MGIRFTHVSALSRSKMLLVAKTTNSNWNFEVESTEGPPCTNSGDTIGIVKDDIKARSWILHCCIYATDSNYPWLNVSFHPGRHETEHVIYSIFVHRHFFESATLTIIHLPVCYLWIEIISLFSIDISPLTKHHFQGKFYFVYTKRTSASRKARINKFHHLSLSLSAHALSKTSEDGPSGHPVSIAEVLFRCRRECKEDRRPLRRLHDSWLRKRLWPLVTVLTLRGGWYYRDNHINQIHLRYFN